MSITTHYGPLTEFATAHIARIWNAPTDPSGFPTDTGLSGFTREHTARELSSHTRDLAELEAGRIQPHRIIGRGYLKPKAVAREWLTKQIAECINTAETHGEGDIVNRANAIRADYDHRETTPREFVTVTVKVKIPVAEYAEFEDCDPTPASVKADAGQYLATHIYGSYALEDLPGVTVTTN